MADFYYSKDAKAERAKLCSLKGDAMDSWSNFSNKVFKEGVLPAKTKELIAVASAHVTRCPYCIAGHTRLAKQAGASDEEIAEAILVAVAMSAGASLAHSNIAMKELEG
jgi:AhpD family alkylhydroperoxidase